jgi:anti-anti-sigma regulatory factor
VFSLFGRKEKPEPRRVRDGLPARIPDSTLRGPATAESQRELARRTAEKIDQIESEMIAAVPATRSAPVTQPMPAARPLVPPVHGLEAQTAARTPPAPLPPLEFATSVVLGNAHGGGIEVSQSNLPPELEEAAILYANGQPQPAAATLKAAIARGGLDQNAHHAWRMLFDVLQAIGDKAGFEAVALDFAARFEKSPPAWQGAAVPPPARRASTGGAVVGFPARIDASVQRQLEQLARAAGAKRAITIDFGTTSSVDPAVAATLVQGIVAFERGGLELVVTGAQRLFDAARAAIEPGRRDDPDGCWQLAMLGLRLLGEKQAFDDLAIDFCVTYEVSPPSWEPLPPCIRTARAAAQPAVADADDEPAAQADGSAFALRGEIAGRMTSELAALRQHADGCSEVLIDCRALSRLDFVAAGELLNEVAAQCAAGRAVLFVEPSAIVEALLVVMGIHELAEIRRRKI